jgi:DNA-binding NtrC family response regulator
MRIEKIVVLDDESNVRVMLTDLLREMGYSVLGVSNILQARAALEQDPYDLLLCDMRLGDEDGLVFIKEVRENWPSTCVMLITGFGTLDSAVKALRLGVFDYLLKPIDPSHLAVAIQRLEDVRRLQAENTYLRHQAAFATLDGLEWGQSPGMTHIRELIGKIAPTDATVLVQGESGTGKEIVARALHVGSSRENKPFIKVNCAAIPANLLESEFFGHEKGAFTGAVQRRQGRFELAHEGTILLDEISEIPSDLQVKLLRALQEREFERVGGTRTLEVNVRVIATTNRHLRQEVEQGRFREDLYYRLNVVPIELPPLRERGDDITRLANYFIAHFARKHGKPTGKLTPEMILRLKAYSWPGNVRELQNLIERAVILAPADGYLRMEDMPAVSAASNGEKKQDDFGDIVTLEDMERSLVQRALKRCEGNRTQAAKLLGISIRTLRNKISSYCGGQEDDLN